MTIPRYSGTSDWPRKVADEVNRLLVRVGLLEGADTYSVETIKFTPTTEPGSPVAGMAYFDSGTLKLRVHDGTNWNDCW